MYKLLNLSEVAEMLGVTKATIYSWTSRNKIPHIKLSKRLLKFREEEIMEWIENKSIHKESERMRGDKKLKRPQSVDNDRIEQIIRAAKKEILV